jgi:cytidylate kinase
MGSLRLGGCVSFCAFCGDEIPTMIVTIDGPAGAGKSTAARGLAARLGFRFLDTGAMYRVVAWKCLQELLDLNDEQAVARAARQVKISFENDRVFADSVDVTASIRTPAVTEAASVVAANEEVRKVLARSQRKLAEGLDIVTEGRDQGTVVFPNADRKFFLTADPQQRANRRQREFQTQGTYVAVEEIFTQIRDRDHRDQTRQVAPLRAPEDAVRVDTSHLNADEVLAVLVRTVQGEPT